MPTSVGHSLLGYIWYLVFKKNRRLIKNWKTILFYLFIANAPDLDLIPGIFIGHANRFHHGITHTLGFSIFVALILCLVPKFRKKKNFIIFFLLYFTHVIADFLCADTTSPFGVMLFWPFTKKYFISFYTIFLDIHKTTLRSLFDLHNFKAIIIEVLIFLPIIVVLKLKLFLKKQGREKEDIS
ncbi:metal-dependent hydrolase [Candidatus Aerophobetes bacterium]|nr:metal-dependent hydrolase [Candidatus Aerophobetes bacterium]